MRDGAKELQLVLARHGFWLDQDDAVRLTYETNAGLPVEHLIQQATALARPLTAAEKTKFAQTFGLEVSENGRGA